MGNNNTMKEQSPRRTCALGFATQCLLLDSEIFYATLWLFNTPYEDFESTAELVAILAKELNPEILAAF